MAMTLDQIAAVLGPTDKEIASAIVATDATAEDLEEAWAWLQNDEALINQGRPLPTGKVAELIEILSPASEDEQ
ncbi:MAG: hypothetical protein ACLQIQ_06455 [Beijerinckiaceae bacterium]